MKTKQQVFNLQNKVHTLEKEISSIQEKCKHPATITKFDKKNSIRVFCIVCDKKVGMPSEKQIKDFLMGNKDKK